MPIPGPRYDRRPGAEGAATARLVIVGMLCALQYWLLTSTMEAYHAGDRGIPLVASIASLACFALAAGLVATAERAAVRARRARAQQISSRRQERS